VTGAAAVCGAPSFGATWACVGVCARGQTGRAQQRVAVPCGG
jgi:hypothetical protein